MTVAPDSIELVETLKTMGYKTLVISTAFQFCTEPLARKAALDAATAIAPPSRRRQAFTGAISPHHDPQDRRRILGGFLQREGIARRTSPCWAMQSRQGGARRASASTST